MVLYNEWCIPYMTIVQEIKAKKLAIDMNVKEKEALEFLNLKRSTFLIT